MTFSFRSSQVGPTVQRRWYEKRITVVLGVITILVLILAAPRSLSQSYNQGEFYVLSRAFFEDIPKRFTGAGRFRFIMQPLIAITLGILSGIRDAHEGRPPYFYAVLFHPELRSEMLRSGFRTIINLLLMSILLDAIFQRIILGISYPAAAIVVGPILILAPYSISRACTNRFTRLIHNKRSQRA
jgi:hypothetical protein